VVNPFDPSRKLPPRVVYVSGKKLRVRVVKYLEADGHDLLGAFNSESMTIFLLSRSNWRSVLFHEMLHAALYISGASEGLTYNKEESIVLALEHAMFPFFER
jgi:hypothetical protein